MESQGDCYDNAMCESVFATLECELIERETFATRSEARLSVFTFIEGWYNPDRLHSGLDYQSPVAYEEEHLQRVVAWKPATVDFSRSSSRDHCLCPLILFCVK
jgi:putative transposase